MKLNIQLFGGRGASSSRNKLEVGSQYTNDRGTILKIVGKTPRGNYEYIEMGSRGVVTENELKQIIKENNYKIKKTYTEKEIEQKQKELDRALENGSYVTIQRIQEELQKMKKRKR